jgi:hypothetical protein
LLKRYQIDPQLYGVDYMVDDEDESFFLEIDSYFSLEELDSPDVRSNLVRSVRMSNGNLDASIAAAITAFLSSEEVFGNY